MIKHSQRHTNKLFAFAGAIPLLLAGIAFTRTAQAATVAEDIKHLDALLSRTEPDQDCVRLDDMRIRASNLQAYRDRLANPTGTRAAVHPWTDTWPGSVIPYAYDGSVSVSRRAEFEASLREWQLAANLKFVPRTTQADYIRVVAGHDGNWSWIGKIGGAQELHIQQWGDTGLGGIAKFLICHEIGHALGFIHEQCRDDRDNYVAIRNANVDTASYGSDIIRNFDIVPNSLNQGAYDFDSIMHYRKNTFAKPGAITIQAQPAYSAFQDMMGQMSHLSMLDKSAMAGIYGAARSISGFVRTDNGVALSAANLTITGSSPYRAANPMPNSSNGAYTFRGLPTDTYTVSAAKSGYTMFPASQTAKVAGANLSAVDFIALQGTRISGRITKGSAGVAGVVVTRRNLSSGAQVNVTTNKKGYYGFSNVPTGTGIAYIILPSKSGYVFSTTTVMPLQESVATHYPNVNFSAVLSTLSASTA